MEQIEVKEISTERTNWHRLFETINQLALTDVGLNAHAEYRLMSESPVVDLVVLRKQNQWTPTQLARVPDGPRQSRAPHILMDLKKTESLNERMLFKTLAYDIIYKVIQGLQNEEVQTFLLSSKTPQRAFFNEFEYEPTEHAGVYHSHNRAFRYVNIIVLNQLSSEPYNVFVKCFASREKEARKAFDLFFSSNLHIYPQELIWYMYGLSQKILEKGGFEVSDFINIGTPENVLLAGRKSLMAFIQGLPVEDRVTGLSASDLVGRLSASDRVTGLSASDRVAGLSVEERFVGLSLDEVKAYIDRLSKQSSSNGNGSSASAKKHEK